MWDTAHPIMYHSSLPSHLFIYSEPTNNCDVAHPTMYCCSLPSHLSIHTEPMEDRNATEMGYEMVSEDRHTHMALLGRH